MELRSYTEIKREKEKVDTDYADEHGFPCGIVIFNFQFSILNLMSLLIKIKTCVSVFKKMKSEASVLLSSSSLKLKPVSLCLTLYLQLSLFLSCTKVTLFYPDMGTGANMVGIYPDRVLPAMEYRFYAPDTYLVRTDDGKGNFRGELPAGVYRIRAVNADAGKVTVVFGGLDSYDNATVGARSVQSPMSDIYTLVDTVGDVYTVHEELKVTGYGPVEKRPSPELLTRRLVLVFTFAGGLETSRFPDGCPARGFPFGSPFHRVA
jgi:hypothetical protein